MSVYRVLLPYSAVATTRRQPRGGGTFPRALQLSVAGELSAGRKADSAVGPRISSAVMHDTAVLRKLGICWKSVSTVTPAIAHAVIANCARDRVRRANIAQCSLRRPGAELLQGATTDCEVADIESECSASM